MTPLLVSARTASSCLGTGIEPTFAGLAGGRSGLKRCEFEDVVLDTCIGAVPGVDAIAMPAALAEFACRNNRLALLALGHDGFEQAVAACVRRVGATRVGVFLGTSTSGILETELAYRQLDPTTGALPPSFRYAGSHNVFSVAAFVRALLGLEGPAAVISTACSSSAKVFGSAARLIELGLIDAAVVGGVDSLCLTTLYGFHSLQLTAPRPCRPFAPDRDGISIGEAAAFALLEKSDTPAAGGVALLGVGESNDGYHLSSPHPEGLGAKLAMRAALAAAGLEPGAIDYVNLHGTATPSNDSAESAAVAAVVGTRVPSSSTKGATGHALGAAGALEAIVSMLALERGLVPGGVNTLAADPALPVNYVTRSYPAPLARVLSNSFGFGGSNCSLVFGRHPASGGA
jgi:3-oxoacyl-[acyl-carrier-protein] synthase-1